MKMFGKVWVWFMGCALVAACLAGCATTDRRLTPVYRPSVHASGGSGDVYIAVASPYAGDVKNRIEWILGKVKNSDDETTGKVVSTVAPADVVQQAFTQELNEAGYGAMPVNVLPEGVAKGIEISNVSMDLEEVTSLVKDEVTANLSVAIDVWKNGRKVKRFDYKSRTSDFAVKDKERLAQDMLENSLHDIMKQAVPDVIKVFAEK